MKGYVEPGFATGAFLKPTSIRDLKELVPESAKQSYDLPPRTHQPRGKSENFPVDETLSITKA